jgi:thiamine kinase-like enzyme
VDGLAELLERIWPGAGATAEPLGGGITNHNFKVMVGAESLVLRVGGKDTWLLGIDRSYEHEATRVAASLGVGPEVIAFAEGCLVTRFIEGSVVPRDELDIAQVAATLRLVHGGPPVPGRFDPYVVVGQYRETAAGHGVAAPDAYEEASRRAAEIERRRRGVPLRPCHNDLLNANFIDDGERLRIVDWEYAGMGDPMFDLGNFAANHELDDADELALLEAYGSDDLQGLRDMRLMSDFREAMWGVVQQAISSIDFDFAAYAQQHFERALA